MITPTTLMWGFLITTLVLAAVVVLRPAITVATGGKVFAFVALCVFPVMAGLAGATHHVEQSKQTRFCLSCHTMDPYGLSLHVDDKSYVPAAHYQNARIPRDEACFTCHTDYTMFGDVHSKLRGMRHVYVQYFGKIPAKLKLYTPYNNRECLHCHLGARSFEESTEHAKTPDMMAQIKSNKMSCMTEKCHDTVHDVETLAGSPMWKETQ